MKVAIVTGAGSGIGKAVACALARSDFAVVLAGRRAGALAEVATGIRSDGGAVLSVPTDVSDAASVAALFEATGAGFGRLDLLFNNAGMVLPATPLEDLALESWRAIVDTNLTGSFLCAQAAFRQMKSQDPQGGRIINNGSVAAQSPRPNSTAYTATKHAVTGLTKSIALDGRKYNIACSQIDIGNAATEMTEPMARGVMQPSGTREVEPRFDVQHVVDAVLYIANLPLDVNVTFMTIMPTKMPFAGRG